MDKDDKLFLKHTKWDYQNWKVDAKDFIRHSELAERLNNKVMETEYMLQRLINEGKDGSQQFNDLYNTYIKQISERDIEWNEKVYIKQNMTAKHQAKISGKSYVAVSRRPLPDPVERANKHIDHIREFVMAKSRVSQENRNTNSEQTQASSSQNTQTEQSGQTKSSNQQTTQTQSQESQSRENAKPEPEQTEQTQTTSTQTQQTQTEQENVRTEKEIRRDFLQEQKFEAESNKLIEQLRIMGGLDKLLGKGLIERSGGEYHPDQIKFKEYSEIEMSTEQRDSIMNLLNNNQELLTLMAYDNQTSEEDIINSVVYLSGRDLIERIISCYNERISNRDFAREQQNYYRKELQEIGKSKAQQTTTEAEQTSTQSTQSANEGESKTIEEYYQQNPDMAEYDEAVRKNLHEKLRVLEGFEKITDVEKLKNLFENNKQLFADDVVERFQEEVVPLSDLQEMREFFKEQLSQAQASKTNQGTTAGFSFVQYQNESAESNAQWEMNYEYRKGKTFQTSKMYGSQTSYDKYDEYSNSALIQFDSPVEEYDYANSAYGFKKDGSKVYTSMEGKRAIKGCSVKLTKEGKIDFTLPENEELLSHPEILANIIKMYPESFKTLPTAVYATDPKMFVTMYELGVKEIANNPAALGDMSKEDYFAARTKDLKFKTSMIMQNKDYEVAKSAAQVVDKEFSESMRQLGGN